MHDSGEVGSPQLGDVEALVLETFGLPLLAYLCSSDERLVRGRLEGASDLRPAAESVLIGELVPLARYIAGQVAAQPGPPRSFSLEVLGRRIDDGTTSIGMALHLASGGDEDLANLTTSTPNDPVKAAITEMTIDNYPLLLAPTDNFWRGPRLTLFQHPRRKDLQAAVQADPVLAQMFPMDDPDIGKSGLLYTSLGRGGSIQDVMFGEMVIASAWGVVVTTIDHPTLIELIAQVHKGVDTLREAMSGGAPNVPGRVVFTGFTLRDATSIPTPWGQLRPLADWERELAPPVLEGAMSGTDQQGNQVTVSYAGEMVLEVALPYAVVVDAGADLMPDNPPKWPNIRGADALRRGIEGVQLAMLLATERPPGSWVTARHAWTWLGDPFGHGSNLGWSDTRSQPGFMPCALSPDECTSVADWAGLIDAHWTPRLDIAVRRFLSAANSRTDMADRLVDAVIVWENLFGTSQGEPRLRISAALAWLLEKDSAERETLQSQIRSLYDSRSMIVHGGKPDESELADQANAALTIARDAMCALFRDRSDVLALSGGAARSTRLILGG
jgi:hypothetical protein